jgi:hypothetical protein
MSPPIPGERVPFVTAKYMNARNRRRQFDLLHKEIDRMGITYAEIATRTGRGRAQISRLLGQSSNMTSDTMSELLFAISGCELLFVPADPFEKRQISATTQTEPRAEFKDSGSTGGKAATVVPLRQEADITQAKTIVPQHLDFSARAA